MCSKYEDKYLRGLYGWKRKCLLLILIVLLVVVVINLGLTLWMLKVLRFSSNGLGTIKIIPDGVQLRSEALIRDKLIATKMTSRKGQPVRFESSKDISISSVSSDGRVHSKLSVGDNKLELTANSAKISDSQGKLMFSADKREVMFGADNLGITGDGGTVVHGSLQSPLVKPEAGQNLTLESPTRSLNVFALHGVNLESRAGEISVQSLNEFKLQSKTGSIILDSSNMYISRFSTGRVFSSRKTLSGFDQRSAIKPEVFQVCLCGKGRLFLAPAEGPCVADNDVCR